MRIVIDTNVALSGLLWGGPPNQLLKWARDGAISIVACNKTLQELKTALGYRRFAKRLEALGTEGTAALSYFLKLSLIAPDPERVPRIIKADQFDNVFLALAAENHASLIVSGDRHLLDLLSFNEIQIVTPREAVEAIMRIRGVIPDVEPSD